jgi:hypothetical protein
VPSIQKTQETLQEEALQQKEKANSDSLTMNEVESTLLIVSPPPSPNKKMIKTPMKTPKDCHSATSPAVQSALSAAVREIQNLRRQLTASEARYVTQNKKYQEQLARQRVEYAMNIAALKKKVRVEVEADRMESNRIAQEQIKKARDESEDRIRIALGQSEVRHHQAMRAMKLKFQQQFDKSTAVDKSTSTTIDKMYSYQATMYQKKLRRHDTLEELARKILDDDDSNRRSSSTAKFTILDQSKKINKDTSVKKVKKKSAGIRDKDKTLKNHNVN